jgi:6-pyruvoyltetrahydropterin/6-carboxytetrahydropterin synthase
MNIRITKEFNFEASHALDVYNVKCQDIHCHSYKLKGTPKQDKKLSEYGMVEDLRTIKNIVKQKVYNLFDHRSVLRKVSRFIIFSEVNDRISLVDYQPTCENMLSEIVDILQNNKPKNDKLVSIFLRENPNSYA